MEDSELITAYHAMSVREGKKIRAFFRFSPIGAQNPFHYSLLCMPV